ncbi:unnamed protein product [Mycena citricolor]|uniref:FAD-binding domain-containing protein n=1 Tax=Mycena citricolor TaxID=2018698 RepID=A0AAD2K9Q3_9AGAR|nr:unnamed protein product [Mycena citricolor]CAK5284914.1 unnamed protein product [Mycena citricolor]
MPVRSLFPLGRDRHIDLSQPTQTDILVIGGGPAGSYAASALAREGFSVTLLEKDFFPRYHIGESMLPSCRPFLRFIGAEEKLVKHGFTVKVGAAVKLNQHKREGYTDFITPDPEKAAFNVIRSEFDELLLRHAASSGARIFEGVSVSSIGFAANQPVSAEWTRRDSSQLHTESRGTIKFTWLVDASGRNGIMSTRYLRNRKFNQALRNVAFWGYWTGAGVYQPGTRRENAPWFEALTDESGWAWFIPLHNGTVSVGVVMNEEASRARKTAPTSVKEHYLAQLPLAPGLVRLLGKAQLASEIKSAGDYSYAASAYAGPHFRIAGDAGAFIDPFFSSGVHLAFTNALSAAATIAASIRGECSESEAARFHNEKTGTSYTRFLLVVLSIYKQINAQAAPVLSDIEEDNFDRAFDFLRPVIQGTADSAHSATELTETTIQRTMDFCSHALGPTTPEMAASVSQRVPHALLAPDGPLLATQDVVQLADGDDEAKHVLWRVNARKAVDGIYDWERNFRSEKLGGWVVRLETGRLGLVRQG